jgi:hypothetical protein
MLSLVLPLRAVALVFAVVGAGLVLRSTSGFVAEVGAGAAGAGAGAGLAATGAGARVVVLAATCIAATGAPVLAAVRVTCRAVCVAGAARVATVGELVALVSAAGVLVSVAGAVCWTGAVGAGVVVDVVAAGSVVVLGVTCCANSGVEESARAAAIAGRALVRIWAVLFLIIRNNAQACAPARHSRDIIAGLPGNADKAPRLATPFLFGFHLLHTRR